MAVIRTWAQLYAEPGFVEHITIDQLKTGFEIVYQYQIDRAEGERHCGLCGCNQPHRHGWLLRFPDGTCSNVGRNCGESKLGILWTEKKENWTRERIADATAQQLADARQLARTTANQIGELTTRTDIVEACRQLADHDRMLPAGITEELCRRGRIGRGEIMTKRRATSDEERRYKFERNIEPETRVVLFVKDVLATIDGIGAMRPNNRVDHLVRVTLDGLRLQLLAMLDTGAPLKAFGPVQRKCNEAIEKLKTSLQQTAAYFEPGNIAKLRHLESAKQAGVRVVSLNTATRTIIAA